MATAQVAERNGGMESTSLLRHPENERARNRMPATNTAPKAAFQVTPSAMTTVYAKNAFSPMYGAMQKGGR